MCYFFVVTTLSKNERTKKEEQGMKTWISLLFAAALVLSQHLAAAGILGLITALTPATPIM